MAAVFGTNMVVAHKSFMWHVMEKCRHGKPKITFWETPEEVDGNDKKVIDKASCLRTVGTPNVYLSRHKKSQSLTHKKYLGTILLTSTLKLSHEKWAPWKHSVTSQTTTKLVDSQWILMTKSWRTGLRCEDNWNSECTFSSLRVELKEKQLVTL